MSFDGTFLLASRMAGLHVYGTRVAGCGTGGEMLEKWARLRARGRRDEGLWRVAQGKKRETSVKMWDMLNLHGRRQKGRYNEDTRMDSVDTNNGDWTWCRRGEGGGDEI